jgi:hypothetical protein
MATTAEVNALGEQLIMADAEGDAERIRVTAYRLLAELGGEHARADQLNARLHTLACDRDPGHDHAA